MSKTVSREQRRVIVLSHTGEAKSHIKGSLPHPHAPQAPAHPLRPRRFVAPQAPAQPVQARRPATPQSPAL